MSVSRATTAQRALGPISSPAQQAHLETPQDSSMKLSVLLVQVALSVGPLEPPNLMESAWQAIIVRRE